MLVAHTDTVGVEEAEWSVPPFAGEIRDGYVYGRGAIDDKGMLAANLVAMLALKRDLDAGRVALTRDVVFLATPDEETVGTYGLPWLVRHAPELLRAEYSINEGGRVRIESDGTLTLFLQVAEKSSHLVTITARGIAGHSGAPRADNAIVRLGRALAAIGDFVSEPSNGASPTMLHAGFKTNVIPADATATLNVRTRPDQSLDEIVATMRRLIADENVDVVVTARGEMTPASPEGSPMYEAIADAARELAPGIRVTPYLSAGLTDSGPLRQLGVKAYGILPFPLTLDDERRMHGADERVPVAAMDFAVRLVHGAVRRIATEPLDS